LHFGSHKLSRVINLGQRIHVRVFSELDAVEVARVFYEPLDNLQDFLLQSQEISPGLRVAVVHDAGNTVLVR